MNSAAIYGSNNPEWILEIRFYCDTACRRVGPVRSAKLDRIIEAAREYVGADCAAIQARNILDGRIIDLRK